MILPVALGSSRLRPAVIHTDAVAGRDPLHHPVKDLLPILSLIKAQIAEVVQEAAGLRRDLGIDSGDVAGERIRSAGIVLGLVAQPRIPVANCRKSDPVD